MRTFKRAKTGSLAITDKPEQAMRHLAMATDRIEAYLEQLGPSIKKLQDGFIPDNTGDYIKEIENLRNRPVAVAAFPVGSIFITVSDTDPSTLLGYGTWELFGTGRVLIGQDTGNPNFTTLEMTGSGW
jgi:hypothetical protein